MIPSARTLLGQSLRDFRRTWPQLILTDLLACVLAVVVLTPVVGLLLKVFLATTTIGVVTDGAIVDFLLHPAGLAALLIVSATSLGIFFVELGQLMVISFGAIEDRRVTWFEAFNYAWRRMRALIGLAWFGMVRLLLISLPFLAAVGALYWFFLRTYDINYYLTQKPPVFLAVVVIAGLLLTVMGLLIVLMIGNWLLALPMVLFEGMGGRPAMRASSKVISVYRWKIWLWLVGWLLAVILLAALATFIPGYLVDGLISRERSSLAVLVAGLVAVLAVSVLANIAVRVCATALFPLLVVRLYRSIAGPGELRPEIATRGTLGEKASWGVPGKTILFASAAALAVIVVGGYVAMRGLDWGDRAQIIAHRGGAGAAPENTIAAFKRGIADGADWLELDVQENADGEIVIAHDRDFMRLAGVKTEVWKATGSELANLDVGRYFGPGFAKQRVPTLREVLDLARDQAGLFIELKYYGHDRSLEAKVIDLVEKTGMTPKIVIMSLNYEGVRKTATLRPTWTYGLLNAVALGDLTHLDVNFLALTANAASFWMVRQAHKRGIKVYAWTIDDPVQISVMMSRGVDGIITNQVALARQVRELRAKLTPFGRFVVWMAGETGLLKGMKKSSTKDDA